MEDSPSLEILHREFQLNPLSQLGNSGLDKTNLSQLHHLQLTTGQSILSQVLYNSGTVPHRFSALNITDNKLQPPSIYSHLPHMIGKPESLVPNIKASQGRTGVSLVFGIPTVKRSAKSYLIGINSSQKLSKIMTCYRPFETKPILRWGIHSDYQKCSQVNFSIPMA